MAPPLALPTADFVARLLRDLFGKAVTPKKIAPIAPATKAYVGTYVDDADTLVGLCLCDLPLSASIGSALALIPAGAAADAARAGQLPAEMSDNLREVLNIMASLFAGPHVRFRDSLPWSAVRPPPVAALLAKPSARLDLELAVAGYAGGRLSLMIG